MTASMSRLPAAAETFGQWRGPAETFCALGLVAVAPLAGVRFCSQLGENELGLIVPRGFIVWSENWENTSSAT